jgi:hypothetical protein
MGKKFRYFLRALSLMKLIAFKMPQYLEDGKLTVTEMAVFIRSVLEIGGWKSHLVVPDSLMDATVEFALDED